MEATIERHRQLRQFAQHCRDILTLAEQHPDGFRAADLARVRRWLHNAELMLADHR